MLIKLRVSCGLLLIAVLSLLLPHKITAQPSSSITLLNPGEGSRVISPVMIYGEIFPGGDNLIRVTLIDQQNNLISRKLIRVDPLEGLPFQFITTLPFEIPLENTPAFLTVAVQDEYHRLQTLRSIPLILQSNGQTSLHNQPPIFDWLTIKQPQPGETLSGGQFLATGRVIPLNGNPIMFELATESGSIVGTSQLAVETPKQAVDFELSIAYDFITDERNVRLIIRQRSDEFASDMILDSVPIILLP